MSFLYVLAGLVLLYVGGESVLKGAVGTAKKLNVSPLLIGLTIVSIGTSLPEFFVTLAAAMEGRTDVSIGNIVGSNIANVLFMIGITGFFTTLTIERDFLKRDGLFLVLATLLFAGLAYMGVMDKISGIVMIAALLFFLVRAYLSERADPLASALAHEAEELVQDEKPLWIFMALLLGGIISVLIGADIFVEGAVDIARLVGVSEAVIGLTLVALGTSLPELATVIPAARKKETDIILGNVIGSNIFNTLGVAGLVSLVTPLDVDPKILTVDIPIMVGVTLMLVIRGFLNPVYTQTTSMIFFVGYIVYIGFQFAG